MIEQRHDRTYISRLRTDPRTKAMFDGWTAQACMDAEQRYPDPRDHRQACRHAAEEALMLAMSFVLDNDGELQAAIAERDKAFERMADYAKNPIITPLIIPADAPES